MELEMNMRKLILAAFVSAALAGCTSVENAVSVATSAAVPATTAMVAANSFDAIESVATGYLQLPLCVTGGALTCRTQSASKAIVPAIRSGRAARNAIEGLLCSGSPCSPNQTIPAASYNTIAAAITSLDAVYAQYNIAAVTK
jgi:hypothetical protein